MEEIINKVMNRLDCFTPEQLDVIKQHLYIVLNDYDFTEKETSLVVADDDIRSKAIRMFFVSKKVEGCTDRTLTYYRYVVRNFFQEMNLKLEDVSADSIRYYIATRAVRDGISKVSQDNELRVLKSFFKWCMTEKYITFLPTLNVKAIKKEKRIKKPFTEKELEMLRQHAGNQRDLALVDVLYSTGARVSEVAGMNRSDIKGNEILVFGKGEKERYVYLNARAQLSLEQYIGNRKDNEDALFVNIKAPHTRISSGAIEGAIAKIGKRAGISNCHPHRFRRTVATNALNRGMPIEEVKQMLGHESIQTTTIYARSDKENVKSSHRKYVI